MSGIARQISAQNTSKVSVLIMQSCPHAWVRLSYLPVQCTKHQLPYILPFFQIVTVAVVFSFSSVDIMAAQLLAAEAKDLSLHLHLNLHSRLMQVLIQDQDQVETWDYFVCRAHLVPTKLILQHGSSDSYHHHRHHLLCNKYGLSS